MSANAEKLVLSYEKDKRLNNSYTLVINAGAGKTRNLRVIRLDPPKSRMIASGN